MSNQSIFKGTLASTNCQWSDEDSAPDDIIVFLSQHVFINRAGDHNTVGVDVTKITISLVCCDEEIFILNIYNEANVSVSQLSLVLS